MRLQGVTKHYGDVRALDDLTLDVRAGELMVLVGPSGSGKSTVLRVLAGLEPMDAGTVHVDGHDVTDLAPHRRDIAMVFQDYALYPHLTVAGNIGFGLRARRVPAAEARQAVTAAAAQLGLGEVLDRFPDQLSGGQQQRVALGRAMVRDPAAYLMDEPLSNLDAQLRHTTRADIVALHRRLRTTTVYVTHDQAEAMTMGDRVAVLRDGRLLQVGTPREVYDTPADVFVAGFLGSPPMNLLDGGGLLGGPAGTRVGIRPEDLHVDAEGPIAVRVELVESLGSETVLQVRAEDGTHLAVRCGPRVTHAVDDQLCLLVDTVRLHVFDRVTGRRRP
ncbi:ATP-binding cassette domain-containing protein [soil metagenome]